jgi:hypothetical protein
MDLLLRSVSDLTKATAGVWKIGMRLHHAGKNLASKRNFTRKKDTARLLAALIGNTMKKTRSMHQGRRQEEQWFHSADLKRLRPRGLALFVGSPALTPSTVKLLGDSTSTDHHLQHDTRNQFLHELPDTPTRGMPSGTMMTENTGIRNESGWRGNEMTAPLGMGSKEKNLEKNLEKR